LFNAQSVTYDLVFQCYKNDALIKGCYHFIAILIRDLYCYFVFPKEENIDYAHKTIERIKRCEVLLAFNTNDWDEFFSETQRARETNNIEILHRVKHAHALLCNNIIAVLRFNGYAINFIR